MGSTGVGTETSKATKIFSLSLCVCREQLEMGFTLVGSTLVFGISDVQA